MAQSISTRSDNATSTASELVDQVWEVARDKFVGLVVSLSEDVTPSSFMEFELELSELVRELGRGIVEQAANDLEKGPQRRQVIYRGLGYRRLRKKTRNQNVSTLFGNICLTRFSYRHWDEKHVREPCIFPLELRLGLIEGVTPALGSRIGKHAAKSPQRQAIDWLKEEHGVRMGMGRLRKFISALSPLMSEHRHALQVKALLEALDEARQGKGSRKPVLAVGRDGVTMCENRHSFWEVATAATVTVFDRRGKRLLTVYLAHSPELGQASMSTMLTDLLTDVLDQWEGPLPTLAYIADSGGNESSYFEDALRRMKHPRTSRCLKYAPISELRFSCRASLCTS
jgi:hypothetical protein